MRRLVFTALLMTRLYSGTSPNLDSDEDDTDYDELGSEIEQTSSSDQSMPCECQCCSEPSTPFHPKNVMESGVPQRKEGSGRNLYLRRIQPSWYEKHPWISVCTSSYKIFCAICRSAKYQGLLTFPKRQKFAFVDSGFMNWKKALKRFLDHENSTMHKEALLKLAAKASYKGIDAQLQAQRDSNQASNRKMLMKLLSCVRYLSRQGLALRGHNYDMEGNLYQLLLLLAQDCPEMSSWLHKREYISPEIINEIIKLMGQSVLQKILASIKMAQWFSILADEATDVSHNEQISLSIRWVDKKYEIHEDTLGLVQLPNTKAETIFSAIKDILIRCSLPLSQCRGQAYDGASNMSGIRSGAQALMKKEESRALYVHCLAHNLNLTLKDVTKKCELIRDVMSFIYDLIQLIKFSPKRLTIFDSLRKEVSINSGETTPSLRSLCPTRWTVRHSSIDSILKNYKTMQLALEEIKKGHDEYAAKASGLLTRMENFDTYFALHLAFLLFAAAEQLSTNLQAKDTTVQEAIHGSALYMSHLNSLRSETKFNQFYEKVIQDSSLLTEEPELPRQRKVPRRFDSGGAAHIYSTPKDRYRHAYFESLELAAGEVQRRFDQADLAIIGEIEKILMKSANGEKMESIPEVVKTYIEKDIDLDRLKIQLCLLPDLVKTAFTETVVTKVTNVRTISEAMEKSEIYKQMLSEIDKLVKLYFTFPVTTSTAERSFSSLRRLKTFLRSTMTDCRLNNLFLLYIHPSITDSLDLCTVAKEFISVNSRRVHYFGSFL